MSIDLSKLKKRNKKFSNVKEQLEKDRNKTNFTDDRMWKYHYDKETKIGRAIIRFLPRNPEEIDSEFPWVSFWNHSVKNFNEDTKKTEWYIERSRKSLGKDEEDPMYEYNGYLYGLGTKESKKVAGDQSRNKRFLTNILVISDPAHPENEGKVFLWEYGPAIHKHLTDAMIGPAEEEEEDDEFVNENEVKIDPFDPFDVFDGKDFVIKTHKGENGFLSYDKSFFKTESSPVSESEEEISKIWKSAYPLDPEVAENKFRTYDQLKARMIKVFGSKYIESLAAQNGIEMPKETKSEPEIKETQAVDSKELDEKIDNLGNTESDDLDAELEQLFGES